MDGLTEEGGGGEETAAGRGGSGLVIVALAQSFSSAAISEVELKWE